MVTWNIRKNQKLSNQSLFMMHYQQTTLLSSSPHNFFSPKKRSKEVSVILKIPVGSIWMPSGLWFWITLHCFTYHSGLVFLCFFSCNKLVLYSEYICVCENTFVCPKCPWKHQWRFPRFRQLLQVLWVCEQHAQKHKGHWGSLWNEWKNFVPSKIRNSTVPILNW